MKGNTIFNSGKEPKCLECRNSRRVMLNVSRIKEDVLYEYPDEVIRGTDGIWKRADVCTAFL